jgi:hypothetical protein
MSTQNSPAASQAGDSSMPEPQAADPETQATEERSPIRVRARRTGTSGVDLRVHWEDEAESPPGPPPPAPAAAAAAAAPPPATAESEPKESNPHSLPETHHQQPVDSTAPALGPHDPANPAARPPNPECSAHPSSVHMTAGVPAPVCFQ